jgi:hypothetical protein
MDTSAAAAATVVGFLCCSALLIRVDIRTTSPASVGNGVIMILVVQYSKNVRQTSLFIIGVVSKKKNKKKHTH